MGRGSVLRTAQSSPRTVLPCTLSLFSLLFSLCLSPSFPLPPPPLPPSSGSQMHLASVSLPGHTRLTTLSLSLEPHLSNMLVALEVTRSPGEEPPSPSSSCPHPGQVGPYVDLWSGQAGPRSLEQGRLAGSWKGGVQRTAGRRREERGGGVG